MREGGWVGGRDRCWLTHIFAHIAISAAPDTDFLTCISVLRLAVPFDLHICHHGPRARASVQAYERSAPDIDLTCAFLGWPFHLTCISVVGRASVQAYERSAIEAWLRDKDTSPLTGARDKNPGTLRNGLKTGGMKRVACGSMHGPSGGASCKVCSRTPSRKQQSLESSRRAQVDRRRFRRSWQVCARLFGSPDV